MNGVTKTRPVYQTPGAFSLFFAHGPVMQDSQPEPRRLRFFRLDSRMLCSALSIPVFPTGFTGAAIIVLRTHKNCVASRHRFGRQTTTDKATTKSMKRGSKPLSPSANPGEKSPRGNHLQSNRLRCGW